MHCCMRWEEEPSDLHFAENGRAERHKVMNIQMIGIDHSMAAVEYREIFSFTKSKQRDAMHALRGLPGVNGCVILSTCNRMEIYISTEENAAVDLYGEVCRLKQVKEESYRKYFTERQGTCAAEHLFYLASGLESRIVGEDQILMQVKEALSYARECDATDKVLEVLFRMAVTVGKKVKTEIHFSRGNSSAIHEALAQLEKKGAVFAGRKCMVIGNGEMGRLTALTLKEAGADVTVTVRQYRSGKVLIPDGCRRIHYGERYEWIPECSFIVSATASPNLTLVKEEIEKLDISDKKIFLDLAVPRDIDPAIAEIENAEVYDIDSFQIDGQSAELKEQLEEASELVHVSLDEFVSWYECRNFIPMIQNISKAAAKDVSWRMGKTIGKMELTQEERKVLETSMETVSAKVFNKLLFELRDSVSTDMLRECLEAFANAYPEVYS